MEEWRDEQKMLAREDLESVVVVRDVLNEMPWASFAIFFNLTYYYYSRTSIIRTYWDRT